MNNAIEFNNVWKKFKRGEKFNSLRDTIPNLFRKVVTSKNQENALEDKEFWATKDVSFNIEKGGIIGIIGPNGAGKSTILKLLSGIIVPNKGSLKINGRLSALIEVTAGFHNELTGRENVYLNGTILGMKKKEIDAKFDAIEDFSGIKEFIDTPVKRYSSGMFSRLGFSVAAHMNPDVLLVDEVLSVGDISFQAKCAQKMREMFDSGVTIVLVSHNLSLIQSLCQRVILLDKGAVIKEGKCDEVIPFYENIVFKQQEEDLKKKINTSLEQEVKVKDEAQIEIKNVFVKDIQNKVKDNFKSGETVRIEVAYLAKKEIVQPVFTIEIVRSDGVLCCSSTINDDGAFMDSCEGNNKIKIDFKEITLTSGIYMVRISIWDKDLIHPYLNRNQDVFRIETAGKVSNAYPVFVPETEWTVE